MSGEVCQDCGAVQWFRESVCQPGLESCATVSNLRASHSTVLEFIQVYDYVAIDRGGYLCTNSLKAGSAAWLNASEHRDLVGSKIKST